MSFHLFRRMGSVFLLDDDADYLDLMAMLLPPHWHIRFFLRPQACLAHMRQEQQAWAADCYRQETLVDLWRQGRPLVPQLLRYWSRSEHRHGLTQVGISDHLMPGLTGLELFSQLRSGWPGARMLLTGQADERVAVDAFNHGLIDQYIPKQSAEMAALVADGLRRLADRCHDRHDTIWRATLRPQQMALFRQGNAGPALKQLMEREWIDSVVIGDPLGVLGLDMDGQVTWLQLIPREAFAAHAAEAAAHGLRDDDLHRILDGQAMVNLPVREQLGLCVPGHAEPTFPLDDEGRLLAARFILPPEELPGHITSYRDWLAAQGPRIIQRDPD